MPSMKLSPSRPADAWTFLQCSSASRRRAGSSSDPFPADQREARRRGGDLLDLRRGQGLPVQRHAHVEVQERVRPEARRRARADGDLDLRPRRPLGGPPVRHAHHHARFLEDGNVLQEPVRVLGRQGRAAGTRRRSRPGRGAAGSASPLAAPARAAPGAWAGSPPLRTRGSPRRAVGAGACPGFPDACCRSRGRRRARRHRPGSRRGGNARGPRDATRRAATADRLPPARRTPEARRGTPRSSPPTATRECRVSRYSPPGIGGAPATSAATSASGNGTCRRLRLASSSGLRAQ